MYQTASAWIQAQIRRSTARLSPAGVHGMTLRVGKPISKTFRTVVPEFASEAGMTSASELNLTTHRAAESVWDRRGWDGTPEQLAVTRWLVGIGGGALAIQGLRQRSVTGSMLAGLGGTLAWWALTGEGDLSNARRWFTSLLERAGWYRDDLIQAASADSFPASDAPAWTPTVGTGLRNRRVTPRT